MVRSAVRLLAVVCAVLAGGCSSLADPFGLNTGGHDLIKSAKEARAAAPVAAPLPRELDKRLLPPYVVEPGDILLVQPSSFTSKVRLPGDQPVLPDGTINLGAYGRLVVAGKTVDQIETDVKAFIDAQEKSNETFSVRVVSRVSKVFYVLGEVNAPGSYPLAGRETVLDAILTAGGVTSRAAVHKVTLSRPTHPDGCRVVLPVCYREIVQLGDTSTNYQILPGDRIFIPSRTFFEELFHKDKDCPPCGGPQTPCGLGLYAPPPCDTYTPRMAPVPMDPARPLAPSELLGPPVGRP
jgi:protein involved in polysaccharide export with SLBB domain